MVNNFKTKEDFYLGMKKSLDFVDFLNKTIHPDGKGGFYDARLLTVTYSYKDNPEEVHYEEVRHRDGKYVIKTGIVGSRKAYVANMKDDSEKCLEAIAYTFPSCIEDLKSKGATILDITVLGD